jgi:hypothetical protein
MSQTTANPDDCGKKPTSQAPVIAPGMFRSKMLKGMLEQHGEEAVLAPVPLKRFVSPSGHGRRCHLPRAGGRILRHRRRPSGERRHRGDRVTSLTREDV